MKRALSTLPVLLGLLTLQGCEDPSIENINWPCETKSDCDEGNICQANACIAPAEANGISDDQITFGLTGPLLSGPTDIGLGMKLGLEIYFAQLNALGGVHERHLILESHDDGYDPARAVENMVKMFEPQRVFAALGCVGSHTGEETFPWAGERGIPFIAPMTGDPHFRPNPPHEGMYHFRASYREETIALANYLLDRRTIAQPGRNIALFTQGDDDQGTIDHFGDPGIFGLSEVLRAAPHSIPEEEIEAWTYAVGERSEVMDEPVKRLLKWLASDKIQADASGKRNAYVLMHAVSGPSVAFITDARRAFSLVQRTGAASGEPGNWTLTPEEVTAIQAIDSLTFAALSAAAQGFVDGLTAKGSFTDSQGVETPLCEGLILTHIVPHFDSQVALVREYRAHLTEHGDGAKPGFASLEGYVAGRIVKEALEAVGPSVTTEGFLSALEGLGEFDIGLGFPLKLGVDEHQASHRVWASSVSGVGCEITPILDEDFF